MNRLLNTTKVYDKSQIRQMEEMLFTHIPSYSVMFYAAVCFLQKIDLDLYLNHHFDVLVGSGNNGGDALIIAGLLQQNGHSVTAYLINTPKTDNAKKALHFAKEQQVNIQSFSAFQSDANCIFIDGILGIGFTGKLSADYHSVIHKINQAPKHRVIAIDVPSGLCANTGFTDLAVFADQTITFIANKKGFYTGISSRYTGQIDVINLGNALIPTNSYIYSISQQNSQPAATTHKGNFKHTLVVGGGKNMFGAACLSSVAALKVGAGKVSMFTHPDYHSQYHLNHTPVYEVMRCDQLDDFSKYDTICIGPGLGRDQWGKDVYLKALQTAISENKPIIIDADGLFHLSKIPSTWRDHTVILTPHESEAATLLGCSINEIVCDRFAAAVTIAKRYECIAVLKGHNTIISDGESVYISQSGNYQLATAGSGDILSGIISGCSYQPYSTIEKVCLAVYQHGSAADNYQKTHSRKSLRALDIIDYLGIS